MNKWGQQIQILQGKFGEKLEKIHLPQHYPTEVPILIVKKEAVLELLSFLKKEDGFEYDFLADMTAIDETPREPRFDIVYNLFSTARFWRIRVKCPVNEEMPTAISVWAGANWAEREIYDMFGIRFLGHPDLRRILLDVRWEGYPLRKDYPLRGYQVFSTPESIDPELLK